MAAETCRSGTRLSVVIWCMIVCVGTARAETPAPECGNGVREADEECDPGPPGSPDSECCSVEFGCVIDLRRVGRSCRAERPLGPCETGDVCSDDGICRPTFVAADPPQRCRSVSGPCDLGEFCDGESAECPDGVQCKSDAGPIAGSDAIEVTCEAPVTAKGRFKCTAVGFEPPPQAAEGAGASRALELDSCGKRRYTRKASARLQASADHRLVNGRLRLPLKKSAVRVLESEGSVDVCILVTVKFAGNVESTERRLVTYP